MTRTLAIAAALAIIGTTAPSHTDDAFASYTRKVDQAVESRIAGARPFLWADDSPARLLRLRKGEVVTERASGSKPSEVEGGLIHDWVGAVFVPGATLNATLALVQDYDRHKSLYPEVVDSRLLSRDGERFTVFLRLRKKKVITAVLDTTHEATYFRVDENRVYSHSRTTRISEVEDAGTPEERVLPPGAGHGFMWALNSYWRFVARDGGVYIECEAVSLSRGIPFGLGWLIGPVVNDLPRESLEGTLKATRAALAGAAR